LADQQCSKISKESPTGPIPPITIFSIYGIIQMEVNKYLAVVTKASIIGKIFNKKIYEVQKLELICLSTNENSKDKIYTNGLKNTLNHTMLYFSDDYDLTHSLQNLLLN
jgi:hypothetical protein